MDLDVQYIKTCDIMQGTNLWGLKLPFRPCFCPRMSKSGPKSGLRKFSAKSLNNWDAHQ